MAKCCRARINKQEKQVVRSCARPKGVKGVVPRLERRQLLPLEIRLCRIWAVVSERDSYDLFASGSCRRSRTLRFARHPFRNQTPSQFFHLRIRIDARRSQELLRSEERRVGKEC